jgi:phage terminase large subunit
MKAEVNILLNRFKPREYQKPLIHVFEQGKIKKFICVWPRGSGKDIGAYNIVVKQALRRPGVYFYTFPEYKQAKRVLWDSILDDNGTRFVDFIPHQCIESENATELKVTLKNSSIIQAVGTDNIDAMMGTNPKGVVFSEYSMQDPKAYQYLRPRLALNDGFAIFISTPRGKNHFYDLYQIASNNPDSWFTSFLTLNDTNHIALSKIEEDRRDGLLNEELIQQEYYCSWSRGQEGTILGKYLDRMRIDRRISDVQYEIAFKVHTSWDLGVRDSTTILFFQCIGTTVRIIDCYENSGYGLDHYIKVLQQKPYSYGRHIAPHDIQCRELGTGVSRLEKARQLGLNFIVASNLSLEDGIEAMRSVTSKLWIDFNNCKDLIHSLEHYRYEYNEIKGIYSSRPLHNFASHYADALRYLAISLPKTADGLTAEELDKRFNEAQYGKQSNMPRFFRDPEKHF